MNTTNKISYGLVVISLLLGSALVPIPFALADDDADKKNKIKDLRDEIEKHKRASGFRIGNARFHR